MKKTKSLTFCAVLSALSVAIMYIGSVIDVLDLSAAAIAAFSVYLAVIELGGAYPWAMWLIVSAISVFVLPEKFGALCFALIVGVYPMFKLLFEKLAGIVSWVLKISMFNTGLIFVFIVCRGLLHIEAEFLYEEVVFFILGNITFVIYDIAMTKLLILYTVKLRKRLKIESFLKR